MRDKGGIAMTYDNQLIDLLREVTWRMEQEVAARMDAYRETQVPPGGRLVLRTLAPDRSEVTQLARAAGVTTQAVSASARKLEEAGLVTRHRSRVDRRVVDVVLTERGRQVQQTMHHVYAGLEAEWFDELGDEALSTTREVLQLIRDLLDDEPG